MPIRYAKDANGDLIAYRQAKTTDGQTKWYKVDTVTKDTGTTQDFIDKTQAMYRQVTPRGRAEAKGPDAVARLNAAEAMPWYEKMAKGAGNEFHKLGAGIADIADSTAGAVAMLGENPIVAASHPYLRFLKNKDAANVLIKRQQRRAENEKQFDEQNAEFNDVSGIPGFIGATAPYLLSEAFIAPKLAPAARALPKMVSGAADKVATVTGKAARATVDAASKSKIQLARDAAKAFKDDLLEPVSKYTKGVQNRPPWVDLDTAGRGTDLVTGTTLGALEGAAHYDRSALDGAVSGFAGSVAGDTLRPFVSRKANYHNPAARETIAKMQERGYRVPPGVRNNIDHLQDVEAGLRKDPDSQNYMSILDNANQVAKNKIAYEAMGVPAEKAGQLTPAEFKEYLQNISKEYDNLVNNTTGILDRPTMAALDNKLKKAVTIYPADKETVLKAERIVKDIKKSTKVGRDVNGQFAQARFHGDDYQRIRRGVKNELDKAYTNNDGNAKETFGEILRALDDAVERGVANANPNIVKEWKDLNERNAVANLLMNHGMDTHGNIDTKRLLGSIATRNDMKRVLTDGGSKRIQDIHLLAKMQDIEDKARKQIVFGNVEEREGKLPLSARLIFNRLGNAAPLLQKAYMKSYVEGVPVLTGLLGMNRYDGFYKPSTFTRSAAQSGQVHDKIIDLSEDAGDYINKKYKKYIKNK